MSPIQILRNLFFSVIHLSLAAPLLSLTPAMFSITLPIVHFPVVNGLQVERFITCRQSDRQAPSIPHHAFLAASKAARVHGHTHRHGYPRHHLSGAQ